MLEPTTRIQKLFNISHLGVSALENNILIMNFNDSINVGHMMLIKR